MKNKKLKISIVILLIITLTMTNFIFLGSSLISYAVDDTSTNHKNIEFDAYFKNSNGQKTTTVERTADIQEISLYLDINVNTEGFFVGQVKLDNSNFDIVGSESEFVSKISENTIYLNQLDVGTNAEIEVKVKPIDNEVININMLDCQSELTLTGIYRDNTEKDIDINATRTVNMKLVETNSKDSVKNEIEVITNKLIKVSGEEKRVIQLSVHMGLNENNYPIKEIYAKINVPEIDEKSPEVMRDVHLNTMSAFNYKYENGYVEITLTNEATQNNNILYRKQGEENVILTYIYEADIELDNIEITSEEEITLHNDKTITADVGKAMISNQEIDNVIEVKANNTEESIYKGKLYSGIEKQYTSQTVLDVNLADIEEYITIKEEASKYVLADIEADSNIYYNKTTISKNDFDTIFGKDGKIEIYNENNELIEIVTSETQIDTNGNIVIDYTGKEPTEIEIKTSTPIAEGSITFTHTKTIGTTDINIIKPANNISTRVVYGYNNYSEEELKIKEETFTTGIEAETEMTMALNETTTEAKLEINRNTLSTIIANDIEMRIILKTDEESKDLYKNPSFTIELPEQVESVQINSINVLYEEELEITNYVVDGRYITIQMQGEQTEYKSQSVEGANIIINATINVNRTSIAKPEAINVTYTNEKANIYANQEDIGRISKEIEVVSPKDVTVINSIDALNIETIGEEETTSVGLQRGTDATQMEVSFEIINNNEENVNNVTMLGTFPTKTEENNIDISVVEGINVENGTVYYTENENATTDIENEENQWTETIENQTAVKKYMIKMDQIASRTAVNGSYIIEIPENLEYNQIATEGYEVNYTKGETQNANTVKSTQISMETGIGPKVEINLIATLAGEELTNTSTVKNGEVIKYRVQVSNVGSEDVSNINIKGMIPEGTKLVKPVDNYEYTAASYYKEVETETFEQTIETLPVGDITYVEYEVMVDSDLANNTSIVNQAEINYLDVLQETNEVTVLSEYGNLRAMVKRVTDRDIDLYETGVVKYFAIVKNTSTETLNNIKVKTNKSENLEVKNLTLITGMIENEISDDELYGTAEEELLYETEEIDINTDTNTDDVMETTEETIEYSEEINIATLEPGESKVLSYGMLINKMPDDTTDNIQFSIIAENDQKTYKSNLWEDTVNRIDVDITMESNTESQYVKSGDNITYTIHAINNSTAETSGLIITDTIPSQLTVQKVTCNGEEQENTTNNITVPCDIPAKGEATITIETIVDYSAARTEAETITNRAIANVYGEEIATTSSLNHIIEADVIDESQDPETDGDGDGNNNENGNSSNNNGQDGNIANGERIISGIAWYDENGNGRKEDDETTLRDITVKLLNVDTHQFVKDSQGKTLEVKTDENGMYVMDNIVTGQYIAIFTYNTELYSLTTYKAEGVNEAINSDVRLNELLVEDTRQKVASTDIIRIDTENVSDINIGLIELQNFDFKLDKYVNRILVQNSAGTTTREYNNAKTAKVELDAKQMKGSNVIIEYNIVVTNIGEVAGYARNIVDYIPNDLEFSSELNRDWYERGNALYTTSLGNDIINPGESRTITLTLTKTMGEDNLVTRNNAEIYEAYNNLGLEDGNSTPGNNVSGENDMSSADVIVSIRTGGVIYMTIGVIMAIILFAGIVTGIIVKRKNAKEEN